MKSGATYFIPVRSDLDVTAVDKVIFTIKGAATIKKEYPGDVTVSNGIFMIPLTQEDTKALAPSGRDILIEGQVNYKDKSVGKTGINRLHTSGTLATELVEGNYPTGYNMEEVKMDFMDGVIVAHVEVEEVNKIVDDLHEVERDARSVIAETSRIGAVTEAKGNAAESKGNYAEQKGDEALAKANLASTAAGIAREAAEAAANVNAEVSKNANATTLTVTDRNGQTKAVQILDGEKGDPGVPGVPGAPGKDYTITEADYEAIGQKVEAEYTVELGGLKEEIAHIDEVIIDTVQPLQKQADATDRSLKALWKVSEGQTYDLETKTENGMNDAPSGAFSFSLEEVYGKSEQETTNGYQIIPTVNKSWSINGQDDSSEYEILDDHSIKVVVKTDSSAYRGVYTSISNDIPNGEPITYSADVTISAGSTVILSGFGVQSAKTLTPNVKTRVTISSNKANDIIVVYNGTDLTPKTITVENIMIERGTVAHDFEPYTNGASPNPDYPQPITSVEEINVTVVGKNLANLVEYKATYDDNGNLIAANNSICCYKAMCKPSTRYTISATVTSSARNVFYLYEWAKDGSFIKKTLIQKALVGLRYINTVTTSDKSGFIAVSTYIGGDTEYPHDLQIEEGTSATDYVPFTSETTTITPPFTLNAIGEYKDMLDVDNGVWRKKVNVHEIIESQFRQRTVVGDLARYYYPNNVIGIMPSEKNVISNKFHFKQTGVSNGEYGAFYPASGNTVFWIGADDDLPTDVVILNPLATEQTFPISAETFRQLEDFGLIEWDSLLGKYIPRMIDTDHHITITDQDGNNCDWLAKYIVKNSEVRA